ncbi:CW-type Zinc Finger [Phytophthora pseudosyringae]|uniref:CW-type Zinc Finger n=1 Tax=Phytophthora pseudosyringae TaxID=221518 RepID=A0A8T1WJ68_9STRA|nr:CW-type Zinc Finger [Phytophthora pseudosyringae]
MADSDASASSSSSSDSVLIRVPLDQRRRKKLRAQLQEDQRRQRERQAAAAASPRPQIELDGDRGKGEYICVVCEREGDELVVCAGPCISAFHARCLPTGSGAAEADAAWLCPSCRRGTHACFHCKQTGVEALEEDAALAPASAAPAGQRPVRKCRALSCGKFYHQDCITQFPLARIAINTHFICPLHTCAGCNQSGAQQEAVRCMRCPVAYHAKCLPPDCVRQISSKLIICPKHAAGQPHEKGGREEKPAAKSAAVSRQLSEVQAQEEHEDEAMSEASAVSASSARRREKREKREKRDKKKKKKKKKKDKHKRESLASQADDEQEHGKDDDSSSKKRKRSKRESLEADESANAQRGEKGSPSTPSSRRTEPSAATVATPSADAGASRSPVSSLALFESPATATKRIQERLEEALGKSDDDDDDSDGSTTIPSLKKKRSSSQMTGAQGDATADASHEASSIVKKERTASLASEAEQYEAKEPIKSPVPSSPVPTSPSGDKDSVEARSCAEEDTPDSHAERKKERQEGHAESATDCGKQRNQPLSAEEGALKLEIPKSPSASVLMPSSSSIADRGLVLKHVPSEGEDDDEEGTAGSATPHADATPRTPRGGRGPGKKKRKNKVKREAQRVLKRETSEEEEDEGNEAKWVQCDSCKKWRTVPRDFNLDAMPKHWYCNMNTWDERFASCDVAEEVLKANPSPQAEKRRNKLKAKSKSTASSAGDDGGYSSSGSGPLKRSGGSLKGSVTDMAALEEKEKGSRSKNKDKASKKRKITKQLKEKYREVKWVQCESTQCGKWRVVPASINFDRLPAVWYCHLNTWAPELANCSAPNPPEVDVFLLKQAKKEGRPSKKARASSSSGDAAPAVPVSATPSGGMTPTSSANDLTNLGKSNSTKHGKGSKSTAPGTGNGPPTISGGGSFADGANSSSNNNNADNSGAGHSTKGRGGRAHHNNGSTTASGIKKTVLEWAQCEKCNKWRKLPQHIKSSTLPDKWYCSMNHWDPSHAKCSVAEEADQEPLPLPPHPGSQWHKGGHKGQRTRRGKLSYSELLYGSTGQLRKAYTGESSTLSFDYEGSTYHRDDQYKHSSMYVSPAAMEAAATMAGWSGSDRVNRETRCSNEPSNGKVDALAAATPPQASVDHVAALVLKSMDLRRRRSVSELFDAINSAPRDSEAASTGLASLAVVTAALGQLEHRGLVEKVDEFSDEAEEDDPSHKRRRTDSLFNGAVSVPTHYRKVPTRPLKASKCWKFGSNVVALSPVNDS